MKQVTVLILFGLIVLTACQNMTKEQNSDGEKTEKVKVGYLSMVSSLTHFVAVEKGYYKEQNLEVEGNPIHTSNLIAQD